MIVNRKRVHGFSLVELVIVIVIIGIIAAIAVPRISRGAKGATESAVKGDLAALRAAIDLYAAEHRGVYPGLIAKTGSGDGAAVDFIAQLTSFSDVTGKTGAYDATGGVVYGPYLRNGIPPLPVGANVGSATVLFDKVKSPPDVVEAGKEGWAYNPTTGAVVANTLAKDESGALYSSY